MNFYECIVSVLRAHREARQWNDEAVAHDLLRQLDLDPVAEAVKARPVVQPGITEDEVLAQEAAAKEAVAKATAAREALEAQKADADKPVPSAADQISADLTEQRRLADERAENAMREPEPLVAADPVPPLA